MAFASGLISGFAFELMIEKFSSSPSWPATDIDSSATAARQKSFAAAEYSGASADSFTLWSTASSKPGFITTSYVNICCMSTMLSLPTVPLARDEMHNGIPSSTNSLSSLPFGVSSNSILPMTWFVSGLYHKSRMRCDASLMSVSNLSAGWPGSPSIHPFSGWRRSSRRYSRCLRYSSFGYMRWFLFILSRVATGPSRIYLPVFIFSDSLRRSWSAFFEHIIRLFIICRCFLR